MDKRTSEIDKIIEKFYLKIKDKYPVKKILLYGSYAKGRATDDSDIDLGVVIDISEHKRRFDITADLFHYARQVNSLIEPKCIFWDEYLNYDKASILGEIIRTSRETLAV